MDRYSTYYSKIDSFKKLREATIKKRYEARLSKRKVELSTFHLQQSLLPINLFSSLLGYVSKPMIKTVLSRLKNIFSSKQ